MPKKPMKFRGPRIIFKGKKSLKKAQEVATSTEDKEQNKVLFKLTKDVRALKTSPELKCWIFYDNFAYGTSYSTTFAFDNPISYLVNGPTRGTNSYSRIGDKIRVTSCRINGIIYPTSAPGIGIDALCRIIVTKFKSPQGRNTQLTGFATSASLGPPLFHNTAGNYLWPQQTYCSGVDTQADWFMNYDILYDQKFQLCNKVGTTYYNAGAINQMVNPEINFDIKVSPNCITDLSLGNSGTYADFVKNMIHVHFITETNSDLTLKLNTHCYFYDN